MAGRRLLQRQQIYQVAVALSVAALVAAVGYQAYSTGLFQPTDFSSRGEAASRESKKSDRRLPASTSINDFTPEQIRLAEWSVSPIDFENSDPGRGRSYFDYVFSKMGAGNKRVYDVPYPFEKAMDRLNQYMGFSANDSSALKVALFPMGRSLQRNAALIDSPVMDINLFFRFPRIVVGVEKEPKQAFVLNLKNRLFLGFHEKSKVIEAISYNDSEGRYEYQVVRDYEAGKIPKVVYANRQLCLSCHQNQTPIFSKSPWSESNAHNEIIVRTENALKAALGEPPCDGSHSQIYCAEKASPLNGQLRILKYFGAPTAVDLNTPYALDTMAGQGNYLHALQKIWLNVCSDIDCKRSSLKIMMRYLLNGEGAQLADPNAAASFLLQFENRFRSRFPNGLKLPEPKIPNRDPLAGLNNALGLVLPGLTPQALSPSQLNETHAALKKDVKTKLQSLIAGPTIPGELEPLAIRPPLELWMSTEPDQRNLNKLITGFADFFTQEDIKALDRWLIQQSPPVSPTGPMPDLPGAPAYRATCQLQNQKIAGQDFDLQLACPPQLGQNLALQTAYFQVRNQKIEKAVLDNLFFYPSAAAGLAPCDRRAPQTISNRASGLACPALQHAQAAGSLSGDWLTVYLFSPRGVRSRLIDGRALSALKVNIKTGEISVQLTSDILALDQAIDSNAFTDAKTKKAVNAPFNRKNLLQTFARSFAVPIPGADFDETMGSLEKNLEIHTLSEEELLGQVKNPIDSFTHSCGMCHYNFEGTPPAFLGLKQNSITSVGKCQRIEICAPRILYRIKMRNCSPDKVAQFQKSPMPMANFFSSVHVDPAVWQQKIAPSLIGLAKSLVRPAELAAHLVHQSVDSTKAASVVNELLTKDCPNVDFQMYENLPRCEFSQLRADSACAQIMKQYDQVQ